MPLGKPRNKAGSVAKRDPLGGAGVGGWSLLAEGLSAGGETGMRGRHIIHAADTVKAGCKESGS